MTEIWKPQPKQAVFMRRWEDEALFGGAAGGGKSDALVAEALRQVGIPHYRGLILRKTYPELTDLIGKSQAIYLSAFPKAKYNDTKHTWTFPSGATITFGALNNPNKKYDYQGKAFAFIGFDELTQFGFEEYKYLSSRNRAIGKGTRQYIRATCNPGGVGHGWVKERFVTPAPPMTTMYDEVTYTDINGEQKKRRYSRIFVPSTVYDNRILMANDPDYIVRLASMPEAEKQALLYGSWDSFSGQVFTEWRNDIDGYESHKNTHVIAPFDIPEHWAIYMGFDWGFSRPFSACWFAVNPQGVLYHIREYYGCTGVPNEGVKLEPSAVARQIKAIEEGDSNLRGRTIRRIGDPAIWGSDGTESVGSLMEREGVYFEKGNHARIDGKMQYHHRLAFDENGRSMFYVFNTCKNFIRTIPALVYSKSNVEDIDTATEDHIYDACRYVLMERPIAPRRTVKPTIDYNSPLEVRPSYDETKYSWYTK